VHATTQTMLRQALDDAAAGRGPDVEPVPIIDDSEISDNEKTSLLDRRRRYDGGGGGDNNDGNNDIPTRHGDNQFHDRQDDQDHHDENDGHLDTDDEEEEDDDDVDDDDDDELEEDYDLDDDEWDETSNGGHKHRRRSATNRNRFGGVRGFFLKIWKALKGVFLLVVNVENLWDSTTTAHGQEVHQRRNHCVVLIWFVILATSYTLERTSFKLLVDRTGPFRLLAVEMVTLTHAMMIGCGMLISAISRKDFTVQPLGLPVVDVGLMALLDTFSMLLMYITGYHVAPTLTVILIQFTIPLTALISQFVHSDGCFKRCCRRRQAESSPGQGMAGEPRANTRTTAVQQIVDGNAGEPLHGAGGLSIEHVAGSIIISLAVLLALCPSIYTLIDEEFFIYADEIPMQTAVNTLIFCGACIPIAAAQLYKEHIMLQYKQPVQPDYLNLVLSLFQAIFTAIMSPLVFSLLGLAGKPNWTELYPSSEFSKNFAEGFQCFIGTLDPTEAENGYPDEALCSHSLSLVFLNSFSMMAVGVAVDKIVKAGATKVMYRGVSGGIILAVISLFIYDMRIPDFSYGAAIDSLNLVCLILLVVGSEVYHRVSLQDATFETIYPEVEGFYFDDVE
jgi:CRT-like, chloroquine-resistance transporter-like